MKDKRVFELVLLGLFFAIIGVLTIPPGIGYALNISFLGVSITIIHIPVIVGAILLKRKYAYLLGLFFGVTCLMLAWHSGIVLFQNPLIAVVPRVLFGFLSYEIYNVLKMKNQKVRIGVSFALSTLCHTLLVTLFVFIFGKNVYQTGQGFVNSFLLPIISLNGILEIVLAVLVGVPVMSKVLKVYEDKYANIN